MKRWVSGLIVGLLIASSFGGSLSLDMVTAGPAAEIAAKPVWFPGYDGMELNGMLFFPLNVEKAPAVIVLHGLGGDDGDYYDEADTPGPCFNLTQELCSAGFVVLLYDQRGHIQYYDSEMDIELMAKDVGCAISYLQGIPEVDDERIGLVGHSLGGYAAIVAAAMDERIRAVALWATPADTGGAIAGMLGPLGPALAAFIDLIWALPIGSIHNCFASHVPFDIGSYISFEPGDNFPDFALGIGRRGVMIKNFNLYTSLYSVLKLIEDCKEMRALDLVGEISPRPLLIIQGTKDQMVPVQQSSVLYEHAGEPKKLVTMEDTDHFFRSPADKRTEVIDLTTEWMSEALAN